jgi:hypothetical protein
MIATTVNESGTRRAVTKLVEGERLVSCTCCTVGAECCVYPASCGSGPESVLFYGDTLSGDGTTFGDTTNGVILEDGEWAVYRNGVRSTRACLGMATEGSINVGADLASSYALSLDFFGFSYTATLSFSGGVDPLFISDTDLFGETGGQCFWNGAVDQNSQDFDQGLTLLFNPATCRWELASGPLDFVYAYREDDSPVGTYTDPLGNLTNVIVS